MYDNIWCSLHFALIGAKNTSHWHNFIANNSSVQQSVIKAV